MAKGKGIFEDKRRELPDAPYVTLTEALTWIVASECRGDNYLAEMWQRQGDQNQRDWGSRYGPAWLLRHLELLANGEEWHFDESDAEEDRRNTLRQFDKAKHWLAANGTDPVVARERVRESCDRDNAENKKYEACEDMIVDACAGREIELQGIKYDRKTRECDGVHSTIPHTYFLRPLSFWIGRKSPEGGDLSPESRPELDDVEPADARPSYRQVLIRRDDVLRLKNIFEDRNKLPNRTPSRSRRFSLTLVEKWFQDRVRNWNSAEPPPTEEADWVAAKQGSVGLSRDSFREIRRRLAPPGWLKRGPRRKRNSRK